MYICNGILFASCLSVGFPGNSVLGAGAPSEVSQKLKDFFYSLTFYYEKLQTYTKVERMV